MKVNIGKFPKKSDVRKVNIEIEYFDTWSLDHTLALIILPALLQLKATKHGVPAEFAEVGGASYDMQESFDFYKDSHNDAFDKSCERWEEILDKMIWSFQQLALEDYEGLYHHGESDFDWEPTNDTHIDPVTGNTEKTYKIVDKKPDQHWHDMNGHMMHEERIQEGLDLFAKYYRSLWD